MSAYSDNDDFYPLNAFEDSPNNIYPLKDIKPISRAYHTLNTCNDKIFVFGGLSSDGTFLDDIHFFDPRFMKWSGEIKRISTIPNDVIDLVDPRPSRRAYHAAATWEGTDYIYVMGGLSDSGYEHDLHRFDTVDFTWSGELYPTGVTPPKRAGHSMIIHNDHIYIFGGMGENEYPLNDIALLDLGNNQWLQIEALGVPPLHRHLHSHTLIDNKWYIFGGMHNPVNASGTKYNDIHSFHTELHTWSGEIHTKGKLPEYRHSAIMIAAENNEEIMMWGGISGLYDTNLDDFNIYKTSNDKWISDVDSVRETPRTVDKRPKGRYGQDVTKYGANGNFLYEFGGITSDGFCNVMNIYRYTIERNSQYDNYMWIGVIE